MKCILSLYVYFISVSIVSSNNLISISEETFERAQSGEIVYVTPELKNKSENAIQILDAWTSCSCFKLLDYPKTCDGGDTVVFPIRIDTERRSGSTTQTLTILSSIGKIQTKIYGSVHNDLKSAPSTLFFDKGISDVQVRHFYIWSHTKTFQVTTVRGKSIERQLKAFKIIELQASSPVIDFRTPYTWTFIISNREGMSNVQRQIGVRSTHGISIKPRISKMCRSL